ncbi:MAG TPA: hypothetical protein VHC39_15160 [Rhizomicrobium sp.]|nr:hypothetical protein [Rhizomicrobium sp.]
MDGASVLAVTGTTFHDLIGMRHQQGFDTTKLIQDVAHYNVEVSGPQYAVLAADEACRAALGEMAWHILPSPKTPARQAARGDRAFPLHSQMAAGVLGALLADDAIISLDCRANTYFAAWHIQLRANQNLTGTGTGRSRCGCECEAIHARRAEALRVVMHPRTG